MTADASQLGPIAMLIFNAIGFTAESATLVNVEALGLI
jgi:hypothetical protein